MFNEGSAENPVFSQTFGSEDDPQADFWFQAIPLEMLLVENKQSWKQAADGFWSENGYDNYTE